MTLQQVMLQFLADFKESGREIQEFAAAYGAAPSYISQLKAGDKRGFQIEKSGAALEKFGYILCYQHGKGWWIEQKKEINNGKDI